MRIEIADPATFFENEVDLESLVLETCFAQEISWMVIDFVGNPDERPWGTREFRRYTFEGVREAVGFERTRLWKVFSGNYVVDTAIPKSSVITREWVRSVDAGAQVDICFTDLDCFSFVCSKIYWEQLFAAAERDPNGEGWRYRRCDGELIDFDRPFGPFPWV